MTTADACGGGGTPCAAQRPMMRFRQRRSYCCADDDDDDQSLLLCGSKQPQQQMKEAEEPHEQPEANSRMRNSSTTSIDERWLPHDVWMLVADFLEITIVNTNKNTSGDENDDCYALRSLSETSYALNQVCAAYLQGHLQRATATTDTTTATTHRDSSSNSDWYNNTSRRRILEGTGIVRRLAQQNSAAANTLLAQFLAAAAGSTEEPDPVAKCVDDASSVVALVEVLTNSTAATTPAAPFLRQQQQQRRLLATSNNTNSTSTTGSGTAVVLVTAARRLRQLSDGFAARIHAQRERLLFWTRTAMGAILVTAMMACMMRTTTATAVETVHVRGGDDDANERASHVIDAVVGVFGQMVFGPEHGNMYEGSNNNSNNWTAMRLLVGAIFSATVAVGVSKQQSQQQQRSTSAAATTGEGGRTTAATKKTLLKRSQSVAGDLAAMNDGHRRNHNINKRNSLALTSRSNHHLHLSASTPDLHHFLLCSAHSNNNSKEDSLINDAMASSLWTDDDDDNEDTLQNDPLLKSATAIPIVDAMVPASKTQETPHVQSASTKRIPPRGCVGAYARAIAFSKRSVTDFVKEQRKRAFEMMSPAERTQLSTAFMDACADDDSLDAVRIMSNLLPAQDFYVGSDGTESCALHTASFHGATRIVDFLCRGIDVDWNEGDDSSSTYRNDGGLCNVNETDANGWTALHFAAGAGCVEAVRILAGVHGAALDVQAVNGYTPLQWAQRLQHVTVAAELRRLTAEASCAKQKKRLQQLKQHVGSFLIVAPLLLLLLLSLLLPILALRLLRVTQP